MGLFRRRPSPPPPVVPPRIERDKRTLTSIWADAWGRGGIRSAQTLLIVALIGVVVYALITLRIVVIPVLIALILAAAIGPFVNWMRRRGVPAALATWIALLLALAALGGVIVAIVFAVRAQWSTLVDQAADGITELEQWITSGGLPVDQEQFDEAREQFVSFLTSGDFVTGALAGVVAVGEIVASVLLLIVVLFFFLKDGGAIWNFIVGRFGGEQKPRLRASGARAMEVLGGYLRGTAIIAAVDAVVIGVALFILGVPLALPLAAIVFIGAFIPLVGATVAGALAALVALVANGPIVALIVVGVVVLVNQLEGDLLAPTVLGKSLRLHPLAILFALSAGTILGGIIGAILSVPIAAVAWAVYLTWRGEEPPASEAHERHAH